MVISVYLGIMYFNYGLRIGILGQFQQVEDNIIQTNEVVL